VLDGRQAHRRHIEASGGVGRLVLVGPRDDVRAAVDRRAVWQMEDRELRLPAELFEPWPASYGQYAEQNASSGDDLVEIVSRRPSARLSSIPWSASSWDKALTNI